MTLKDALTVTQAPLKLLSTLALFAAVVFPRRRCLGWRVGSLLSFLLRRDSLFRLFIHFEPLKLFLIGREIHSYSLKSLRQS